MDRSVCECKRVGEETILDFRNTKHEVNIP